MAVSEFTNVGCKEVALLSKCWQPPPQQQHHHQLPYLPSWTSLKEMMAAPSSTKEWEWGGMLPGEMPPISADRQQMKEGGQAIGQAQCDAMAVDGRSWQLGRRSLQVVSGRRRSYQLGSRS